MEESGFRYFQPLSPLYKSFQGKQFIKFKSFVLARTKKMRSMQSIIFQSSKTFINDKKFIK